MGFADLSIADIAAEYHWSIPSVMALCDRFQIAYKDQNTHLALEDAKTVIMAILEQSSSTSP